LPALTKKYTKEGVSLMKIGIFALDNFSAGKESIIDERLAGLKQMAHSAKKVYIEVEVITDAQRLGECDGIISPESGKTDLALMDLEFIEKRINSSQEEQEKNLLNKFKAQLEKEETLFKLELSEDESKIARGYPLLSLRPVFLVEPQGIEADKNTILASAYAHCGYISFFTANEKETRAWSLRKGMSCWQASGLIHSDIQKGFIRAEVISFSDLVNDGGINQARGSNHLRLENKDYIVQDADLIKFRFNK